MTSRVALVMAPLLPGIRIGVGNMGLENGGGLKGGVQRAPLDTPPLRSLTPFCSDYVL